VTDRIALALAQADNQTVPARLFLLFYMRILRTEKIRGLNLSQRGTAVGSGVPRLGYL